MIASAVGFAQAIADSVNDAIGPETAVSAGDGFRAIVTNGSRAVLVEYVATGPTTPSVMNVTPIGDPDELPGAIRFTLPVFDNDASEAAAQFFADDSDDWRGAGPDRYPNPSSVR